MESNNFNEETSKSEDSESGETGFGKTKKKKSAGAAAVLAEISPSKHRPDQKSALGESLWQKLKGDKPRPKTPEVPLFGIPEPERISDKPDTDATISDTPTDHSEEYSDILASNAAAENSVEQETDASLEELSPDELDEVAREFTELRIHETSGEIYNLPLDSDTADSSKVAEAAAGAALLQNIKASLQSKHQSVGTALDNAARVTNQQIEQSLRAVPEVEQEAEQDDRPFATEQSAAADYPEADFSPASESNETPEEAEPIAQPAQGGGGGIDEPPKLPPPVGEFADFPPSVSPVARVGLSGSSRPALEIGSHMSTAEALHNERVASGRGLLVGLLVGNFIGKRRGRIKAEKKLLPVQRKLEKQITNLQETIMQKEQHIKAVAREKFSALTSRAERQQFLRTMASANQSARTENAKSVITDPSVRRLATPESNAATATRYVEAALIGSKAVGELVTGGLLAAAISPNLLKSEKPVVVGPNQRPVIRFDKKAEQLSRTELLQTAEKIKIEGVDLKEMLELGRINESGLRRIVKEFLEGGNISAALSKEVQEKELKFERDPRMRRLLDVGNTQRISGDGAVVSSGALGALGALGGLGAPETQAAQNIGLSAMNMAFQSGRPDKPSPVPDMATLHKIRNQQVAMVGGTTVCVILLILIALWITQ